MFSSKQFLRVAVQNQGTDCSETRLQVQNTTFRDEMDGSGTPFSFHEPSKTEFAMDHDTETEFDLFNVRFNSSSSSSMPLGSDKVAVSCALSVVAELPTTLIRSLGAVWNPRLDGLAQAVPVRSGTAAPVA